MMQVTFWPWSRTRGPFQDSFGTEEMMLCASWSEERNVYREGLSHSKCEISADQPYPSREIRVLCWTGRLIQHWFEAGDSRGGRSEFFVILQILDSERPNSLSVSTLNSASLLITCLLSLPILRMTLRASLCSLLLNIGNLFTSQHWNQCSALWGCRFVEVYPQTAAGQPQPLSGLPSTQKICWTKLLKQGRQRDYI